jgi:hypothetical protein
MALFGRELVGFGGHGLIGGYRCFLYWCGESWDKSG